MFRKSSLAFWFQPVWGLCVFGQNVVTVLHLGGGWWWWGGQWGVLISAEQSDICQIIVYIPSGRTQNPETLLF